MYSFTRIVQTLSLSAAVLFGSMAVANDSVPRTQDVKARFYDVNAFLEQVDSAGFVKYERLSDKKIRISLLGSSVKSVRSQCQGRAPDVVFEISEVSPEVSRIEFMDSGRIDGRALSQLIKRSNSKDTGLIKFSASALNPKHMGLSSLNIFIMMNTDLKDDESYAELKITLSPEVFSVYTSNGDDDSSSNFLVTSVADFTRGDRSPRRGGRESDHGPVIIATCNAE